MKRRVFGLVFSLVVVLALLASSCAPAPEKEAAPAVPAVKEEVPAVKEEAPAVKETAPAVKETAPVVEREAPQYGGVLRLATAVRVLQIDQTAGGGMSAMTHNRIVADTGYTMDWAKGPSGTGEYDFVATNMLTFQYDAPGLVLSWELRDPETIIVHLRPGVRFQNKPPVNGRELDATDVVVSLMRTWTTPGSYNNRAFETQRKPISMTALDKYTVEFKQYPGATGEILRVAFDWTVIEPREIFEQYGGQKNWTHIVGAGPFMISDHVEEAATTYVRNPTYWQRDPFNPETGNRLPYLDGVVYYCIPDISTRLAALRTGKVDHLENLTLEQNLDLLRYSPELITRKRIGSPLASCLAMRSDTPPFSDVRVRRALSMAVDRETIGKNLFGGEYNIFGPVMPLTVYKGNAYIPIAELPPSAREVYTYNPDKARQLLAEAGYSQGFQTEVLVWRTEQIDMASIVAEYFAAINVKLTIDVKEQGVYTTTTQNRRQKAMVCTGGVPSSNPYRFHPYRSPAQGGTGTAVVNDPRIDELYLKTETPISPADWAAKGKMIGDIVPYIVEQAWYIELPQPLEYIMWWPWLKGYSGEKGIRQHPALGEWARYTWIDQALKKTILGK